MCSLQDVCEAPLQPRAHPRLRDVNCVRYRGLVSYFYSDQFRKIFRELSTILYHSKFCWQQYEESVEMANKSVQTNQISIICLIKFINIESERLAQIANVILIFFVIQQFYLGGQFMQAFVLDRSTRDQAKPQIMLSKDCKYLIIYLDLLFPFVLL